MTEADARSRASQLNAAADDEYEYLAQRHEPEGWRVVRVKAPGLRRTHPLKATVESRPRPEEPPDPRPSSTQNIPPFGGGF